MSDFDPQKTARLYDVLRKQIEHEDNLISARVNWFVASQSFLFSAYAIILSNLGPGRSLAISSQQHLLVLMIPTLAAVICILAWMTVLAGESPSASCAKHSNPSRPPPTKPACHPCKVFAASNRHISPVLLPVVFFGVWMLMLIHGLLCGLHP